MIVSRLLIAKFFEVSSSLSLTFNLQSRLTLSLNISYAFYKHITFASCVQMR